MKSIITQSLILLILLFICNQCASLQQSESKTPIVLLAPHDKATRCKILVEDLDLKAYYVPRSELPYSENATAALWIGTRFPYKKAIAVLKFCRNYYPQIKYIAYSDHTNPNRNRGKYELYVGAPTDRALCLGLRAFSSREKKRLLASRTKKQFSRLIKKKYNGTKRCHKITTQ